VRVSLASATDVAGLMVCVFRIHAHNKSL
jgi:hypothetical protein